ncbi:Isochorismatase [Pseudozyma hubeiensis]|nr:Isochorismatase [Pseudozyma hubeiensis]
MLLESILLLVTASCATLASSTPPSYSILVPCGDSSSAHAIVPDATCQQMSPNGAFSLAQLGQLDTNTKIGFSATSDCKQTYTPDWKELMALQKSQACTGYVVDEKKGAVSDQTADNKDGNDVKKSDKQQPQQGSQQPGSAEQDGLVRRNSVPFGGFFKKRSADESHIMMPAPAALGEGSKPEEPASQNKGQLSYVMLVKS